LVINSIDSLLIGGGAEVIISDNVNIDVYGLISTKGIYFLAFYADQEKVLVKIIKT
tara:strand:+ start:34620 stop:34787 length:168 start_codon:yes stop_codon:yes gene_type:complete